MRAIAKTAGNGHSIRHLCASASRSSDMIGMLLCAAFLGVLAPVLFQSSASGANLITETVQNPAGSFFRGKEDGYFWYEDPEEKKELEKRRTMPTPPPVQAKEPPQKEPDKPPPPPPDPVAPPAPPPPAVFSVKWIQEKLPVLRQTAIDNPTEENVAAYMYAQRVMMDKADVFASVWQDVLRKDPMLDENNRFPMSESFKLFALRDADKARTAAIRSINNKAGIFYFFRSDCEYCHAELPLLYTFANEHEFELRLISLDGKPLPNMRDGDYLVDTGQAKTMKVTVVPAIVLAVPPDDVFILTQGYIPYDVLLNRAYLAAEDMGLIDEKYLVKTHPMDRGVLPPNVLKEAKDSGIGDDPTAMVAFLREKMYEALYGPDETGPPPVQYGKQELPSAPGLDYIYPPVEDVRALSQPFYQPTPMAPGPAGGQALGEEELEIANPSFP